MTYKLSASYERMRGFYNLPKNTIDIVFIGTSHFFHAITPMTLWENYGITSYVLAQERQIIECSYAYIKEVLKYQTPKVVVLDVFDLIRKAEISGIDAVHKSIDYMKWSKNKLNIISKIIKDEDMYEYFNNYLEHDTSKYIETTYQDLYNKGEFVTGDIYSIFMLDKFAKFKSRNRMVEREENISYSRIGENLAEKKIMCLDVILQELRTRNIKICCVNTPYVTLPEYFIREGEIASLLKIRNVDFLDFNKSCNDAGIDLKTDFWDIGHVNYWGAKKITKYIGEHIINNYKIKFDCKKEMEEYRVWSDYNLKYTGLYGNIMQKLLTQKEYIQKNESTSDEFEENFDKYIENGVDINVIYTKISQNSNNIAIELVKLEDQKYAMKINYNLNVLEYALISRTLLSKKIYNWSHRKGIEVVFIPDDSKRDFLIQLIDKNGEFIKKIVQLEGTNELKMNILFEDFIKPQNNGIKFNYEKINSFELGISTQWRGRGGSGSIIIKSIKLF